LPPRKVECTLKTVAIVGSHYLTNKQAPWDDLKIPIWVFNAGAIMDWCKRADAVFEIHPAGEYTNPMADKSEYWQEFLQKQQVAPVYMQNDDPRIPMCKKYPLEGVINKYLKNFVRENGEEEVINKYFTSTPCYAIAMALYLGYDVIKLYGIEMETNSEYVYQRDGVGLWIGIALGLGKKVVLTKNTSMFSAPLYGYDDDHTNITREDFEENAAAIERAFDAAERKLEYAKGQLDGIINAVEGMKRDGKDPKEISKMGNEYLQKTKEYEQALADWSNLNGQLTLCRFFLAKMDKMMIANGKAQEVKALRSEKIRAVGLVA